MEPIKLKTNIKCGGCVATVTPFLNQTAGEGNWTVDTASPNKILTVTASNATRDAVEQAVQQAGFRAEPIS